jgi:geranylgeranylglycerol-phosphate geranylgeranyltransferase
MSLEYLKILRPLNGLMSAVAVWIGVIVAGGALVPDLLAIFGMLTVFLISSGGMIANDIADIQIDAINKPKRPLPSGKIKKGAAYAYGIALYAVGNFLAYLTNNYTLFAIAIIATVLLTLYAWKLKKVIFAGHFTVSLMVALTFMYGGVIVDNIFPVLILAILAMLSNIGREIYKSIEDVMGDKSANVISIPIKFGVLKAKFIGALFIYAAIIISPIPYILGIFGQVYLFFVIVADIIFFSATIIPTRYSAKLCKIAMLIALISYVVGALA